MVNADKGITDNNRFLEITIFRPINSATTKTSAKSNHLYLHSNSKQWNQEMQSLQKGLD
tara:strand:- start:421 stop:597 length:177 start_codon:yes stop_codon:yes gene_type:complete